MKRFRRDKVKPTKDDALYKQRYDKTKELLNEEPVKDDYINFLYTHVVKAQEQINEQVLRTNTRATYILSLLLLSCSY